jgi:hypothetical protein
VSHDPTVAYSFLLYAFYVCLPLVPAILIFWLFPDSKVAVSGPLQNFTVNATGAFAAYVVTVLLGFFLVKYIETIITESRLYAVEGVFLDLGKNQYVGSDHFYSQYLPTGIDPSSMPPIRNYNFVVLLDHPVVTTETVWLQYWEISASSGFGGIPTSKSVPLILSGKSSTQVFRLQVQGGEVKVVQVTNVGSISNSNN